MVGVGTDSTTTTDKGDDPRHRPAGALASVARSIARCLQQESEVGRLAQSALNILEAEFGYEFGAVLTIDPFTGGLDPLALSEQGQGPAFVAEDRVYVTGHGVRRGVGITGWVGATGRPACVADVRRDRRYHRMRSLVRSELCVPIRAAGTAVGVLNVESPTKGAFDEQDELRLTAVAAQIAIGLQAKAIREGLDTETTNTMTSEVDHRLRNSLSAVSAMVDVCLHSHSDEARLTESMTGRLHALTVVHDLLVRHHWEGIDLHELVACFGPAANDQFFAQGPPVIVPLRQAPALGLVLHELTTNCRRHGALRAPWGRAGVRWAAPTDRSVCRMQWFERGPAIDPVEAGGGSALASGLLQSDLCGGVVWGYRPDGVAHELWLELDETA